MGLLYIVSHSGERSERFVVFLAKVSYLNLGVSYDVVSYDMCMCTHHTNGSMVLYDGSIIIQYVSMVSQASVEQASLNLPY